MVNPDDLVRGQRLFTPEGKVFTVEGVTEKSVYFLEPMEGKTSSYAAKDDVVLNWMKPPRIMTLADERLPFKP